MLFLRGFGAAQGIAWPGRFVGSVAICTECLRSLGILKDARFLRIGARGLRRRSRGVVCGGGITDRAGRSEGESFSYAGFENLEVILV